MTNRSSTPHRLAELLDSKFTIPGTNIRFGVDPILGLIPGIGDVVAGIASLYFIFQAALLDAPVSVILRMLLNILIDIIIGTIPLLGEIFDFGWKANTRNVNLLINFQKDPNKTESRSRLIVWFAFIASIILVLGLIFLTGWLIIKVFDFIF